MAPVLDGRLHLANIQSLGFRTKMRILPPAAFQNVLVSRRTPKPTQPGEKMQRTKMSEENYGAIRVMIEAEALVPMDPARLPQQDWGKILCGDGDISPLAIEHFLAISEKRNGRRTCSHLISVDGGPAAVSPNCCFHTLTYRGRKVVTLDQYVFGRIEGMLQIKNKNGSRIRNMAYVPHCYCGLCAEKDVPVWKNVLWTIECKAMIRKEFGGVFEHHRIFPFVDYFGYEEAGQHEAGVAYFMVHRGNFERLAQKRGW